MIKNNVEVAPACCIVCLKKIPESPSKEKWIYIASSTPMGAMVCSKECLTIAITRYETNGRMDAPEMKN